MRNKQQALNTILYQVEDKRGAIIEAHNLFDAYNVLFGKMRAKQEAIYQLSYLDIRVKVDELVEFLAIADKWKLEVPRRDLFELAVERGAEMLAQLPSPHAGQSLTKKGEITQTSKAKGKSIVGEFAKQDKLKKKESKEAISLLSKKNAPIISKIIKDRDDTISALRAQVERLCEIVNKENAK